MSTTVSSLLLQAAGMLRGDINVIADSAASYWRHYCGFFNSVQTTHRERLLSRISALAMLSSSEAPACSQRRACLGVTLTLNTKLYITARTYV